MDTIKGNYAEAVVYATGIDDYAKAQIRMICDNDFSLASKIRIMPDCHPGKVGPIGLTMTVGNKCIFRGGGAACPAWREPRVRTRRSHPFGTNVIQRLLSHRPLASTCRVLHQWP